MNLAEIAEEAVSLWTCCEAAYKNRYEKLPSDEVLLMIYDRASHHLISEKINEERGGVPKGKEKKEGRPATEKQMNFIIDLGGDPKWTGTSFGASKYIEELKGP